MTIDQAVANIGKTARYVGYSAAIHRNSVAKILAVTKRRVLVQLDYGDPMTDGARTVNVSPRSLKLEA